MRHPPETLPDPVAGATLRQPRGQRPIGDAPLRVSTHVAGAAVVVGKW